MMEKVKLTEWQKDAIEDLLQEYRKENIVNQHVLGRWGDAYDSLNKLGLDEIVRALYIGYEVEETFEVGDWVVIEQSEKDNIACEIHHTTNFNETLVNVDYGDGYRSHWDTKDIRHATPEEIKAEKERRVWAEIGREVGEFRGGDIGISKNGNTYRDNPSTLSKLHVLKNLKGFYPAESFVLFGGESHDN